MVVPRRALALTVVAAAFILTPAIAEGHQLSRTAAANAIEKAALQGFPNSTPKATCRPPRGTPTHVHSRKCFVEVTAAGGKGGSGPCGERAAVKYAWPVLKSKLPGVKFAVRFGGRCGALVRTVYLY